MFQRISDLVTMNVQLIVEFVKCLPGFNTLCREDQNTLLKVRQNESVFRKERMKEINKERKKERKLKVKVNQLKSFTNLKLHISRSRHAINILTPDSESALKPTWYNATKFQSNLKLFLWQACNDELLVLKLSSRYHSRSEAVCLGLEPNNAEAMSHAFNLESFKRASGFLDPVAGMLFDFCRSMVRLRVDDAEGCLLTAICFFSGEILQWEEAPWKRVNLEEISAKVASYFSLHFSYCLQNKLFPFYTSSFIFSLFS